MSGPLRATWVPARARLYRQAGGAWDVPTLDRLLSGRPGELVDGAHRLDAAGTEAAVARLAGGLRQRGARRGHAVAWQLPNSLAAALLYRACWRIGAVAAPVLHSLGDADRASVLDRVDPAVVVALGPEDASDPDRIVAALGGPPVAAGAAAVRPADPAVVLFTSGSSGAPKAVLHTHRGLSYKAALMGAVHGLGPDDAVLMPAPLAHVSGLLNGVLVPGAASMRSVLVRRFDAEEAVALLDAERVTFMAGPPTFFVAMAHAGARRDCTLRLVSSGGAAVTPAFVEATAEAFGCRVKRTYGSTEAPTVTTSRDDDPPEAARDSDGRAVGEVALRVTDPESGARRGPGRPGELWVRGPELFAGYVDPQQTAAAVGRGGWFRTGDLATVDRDGWLRIVGRLKEVIIRGGENISAAEVEGALEAHPGVRQAVVVGYPDPLMGERVAAFVVGTEAFDLEACRAWFAERGMARFKTPEKVVHLPRLPLLGSGKVDRAALRGQAAGAASAAVPG